MTVDLVVDLKIEELFDLKVEKFIRSVDSVDLFEGLKVDKLKGETCLYAQKVSKKGLVLGLFECDGTRLPCGLVLVMVSGREAPKCDALVSMCVF